MIFDLEYLKKNKSYFKLYLNRLLDYLESLEDPTEIFCDVHAFNAFIFVGKSVVYFGKEIDFAVLIKKNFEKFISKLLNHFFTINHILNFNVNNDCYYAENDIDLNTKRIHAFAYILLITNLAAIYSKDFCINFSLHDGLKAYFQFLKDENFILKNKSSNILDLTGSPLNVLDYITLNILSLSTITCTEHKNLWIELDAVNSLLKIARFKESASLDAFITILLVIDDNQIENLHELPVIVKKITSLLEQCKKDFESNKFERKPMQILFKSQSFDYQVHRMKGPNSIYTSVVLLLDCLSKLAVNDKIKNDLYFTYDIKSCLKSLLTKGNNIEINYSLVLIAQLCFSENVSKDLLNDYDFNSVLAELFLKNQDEIQDENDKEIFQSTKNIIEQINWILNKKRKTNQENDKNAHIMISYNTASREICLKIKEKLEDSGFRVWIDVNDLHGSSFDSMAKAIENSMCVLLCITQSINCQSEAEYAFRLKKKIIPLILEKGYENVKGWLGLIIGDKIFINFTKYTFDESIRRLLSEIAYYLYPSSVILDKNNKNSNKIENWSEQEVCEWFEKNNLNKIIFENLKPCNGAVLKEMHHMKTHSSEFFYKSLKEIEDLRFNSIILFSSSLEKLFNS